MTKSIKMQEGIPNFQNLMISQKAFDNVKTKPTNNMDKIIKGSECGYSAVMKFKNNLTYKLVGFKGRGFLIISLDNNYYDCLTLHDLKGAKFEITDWLYVGELFGNEKLKYKTKMKVKSTEEIVTILEDNSRITGQVEVKRDITKKHCPVEYFKVCKSELTPIF